MDSRYDEDANEEAPRARKRRKIVKEPANPVTRQTRSSARLAAERALKVEDEEDEQNLRLEPDENRIPLQEACRALMPPPKTPQSTRQKEVPSSQSPVDTPFSTQSRKSQRDLSRSPLKEKSTNVRRVGNRDSSARKSVRWAQMLEVADSTEQDDEECQPSPPAPKVTSSIPKKFKLINDSTRFSGAGSTLPDNSAEVLACPQQQSLDGDIEDASVPKTQNTKVEVSDSEADEEDDDFSEGIDTQAALRTMVTQLDNPNTKEESIPITSTWTPRGVPKASEQATSSKQRDCHSEHSSVNVVREPDISATSFTSITQPSRPQLSNHPTTPERCKRVTAPSFSGHSVPSSGSEEASLQLAQDLRSHTQTCIMLETESQFENAWHEYKPPPPSSYEYQDPSDPDESRLSDLTPRALDSEALERNLPFEKAQTPFLPPGTSLPSSSNPPQQHPSSSEATTDDTTQSYSLHASLDKLCSSSPRRPSFPFSSPPQSRAAAAADEYAGDWDGVLLTDSQLLPDSLMNGTLVGPPSLAGTESELDGED